MTLTEFPAIEQGTPEWHDQRRGIVTASVVGRLVTAAKLQVADNPESRSLTALLVSERITGVTEPTYMNDDMMRGVLSEPIARDKYAEIHQCDVATTGFMLRQEDGWTLGYSPDGLVGDDGLLEIKAPRPKTHVRTVISGEVPAFHMAQLQAGLLVSGRKWIDFVSFCGGLHLWVKRVHPDPDWQAAIVAACHAFETTAVEQVSAYETATKGLAMTERTDMELVI